MFDPQKYLTTLKGKSYLEVKWRLLWLRTEHPDASIETELIEHDREKKWCMFKATVRIPYLPKTDAGQTIVTENGLLAVVWASATGYGQEDAAGFVGNPGDYPEKAETKALGRALAALGYGTQFTEDFDFAGGEGRVVDSPVERRNAPAEGGRAVPQSFRDRLGGAPAPAAPARTETGEAATDKQKWALKKQAEERNIDIGPLLMERYSVTTLDNLTKQQASNLFDFFSGKVQ